MFRNLARFSRVGIRGFADKPADPNSSLIELLKFSSKNNSANKGKLMSASEILENSTNSSDKLPNFYKKEVDQFREFANSSPTIHGRHPAMSSVPKEEALKGAISNVQRILSRNKVAATIRAQAFHVRPGEKRRMKRSARHRVTFKQGIVRLMNIVNDARRKGY